jgi:hypothetical protein
MSLVFLSLVNAIESQVFHFHNQELRVTRKNRNISDNIDGQPIVSVKDTGAGIDHEIMPGFLQNLNSNPREIARDVDYSPQKRC